ncbi:translesion DNA synthesis-associated protein ImuA (plasmid) [Mycetohabitans endofungorum]|uniref:translesion DNA synthesis-associated protein ImuA n=1 Tax=Mycetohabitans endofungorum TaxID=417203 RepID=UPI0030CC0719
MEQALPFSPQSLHPTLWRGAELARVNECRIDTGYATLNAELPGGGWPQGALIELLISQPGIGELCLLAPALRTLQPRAVVLINPPHTMQPLALHYWGLNSAHWCVLRARKTADACWAAEQALRTGSCGAVLLWLASVSADVLRRLHLAAQRGAALFFLLRPLCASRHASPAPLRVALKPARAGMHVTLAKRRGPTHDVPLHVTLIPSPVLLSCHGRVDRRAFALSATRSVSPAWVPA